MTSRRGSTANSPRRRAGRSTLRWSAMPTTRRSTIRCRASRSTHHRLLVRQRGRRGARGAGSGDPAGAGADVRHRPQRHHAYPCVSPAGAGLMAGTVTAELNFFAGPEHLPAGERLHYYADFSGSTNVRLEPHAVRIADARGKDLSLDREGMVLAHRPSACAEVDGDGDRLQRRVRRAGSRADRGAVDLWRRLALALCRGAGSGRALRPGSGALCPCRLFGPGGAELSRLRRREHRGCAALGDLQPRGGC